MRYETNLWTLVLVFVIIALVIYANKFSESTTMTPKGEATDIVFLLSDDYLVGETVPVEIMNTGKISYRVRSVQPACDLEFFDDQSGGKFYIPENWKCGPYREEELKPGDVKTLFTWNLDECFSFDCFPIRPLEAGNYTIKGIIYSKDGTFQIPLEKTIKITYGFENLTIKESDITLEKGLSTAIAKINYTSKNGALHFEFFGVISRPSNYFGVTLLPSLDNKILSLEVSPLSHADPAEGAGAFPRVDVGFEGSFDIDKKWVDKIERIQILHNFDTIGEVIIS